MTSTLLPTDEIEELVQSGLPTRALSHHIAAADASIIDLYGPHSGERTITLRGHRTLPQRRPYAGLSGTSHNPQISAFVQDGSWRIHLPYPWAATVAAVAEFSEHQAEDEARAVDAARYALELSGRALRRLDRPWRAFVAVRYTPIDDTAKRALLLIDLVKLSVRYAGIAGAAIGPRGTGVAVTHVDHEQERKKLLHRLMPRRPGSLIA